MATIPRFPPASGAGLVLRRAGGAGLRRHEHVQAALQINEHPRAPDLRRPVRESGGQKHPPDEFLKSVENAASRSPLPRAIKPEEVANATLFLCSDLASAVTAQIFYVDYGDNVMGV